ncbi:hypothetical protein WJX72_001139 [[Myrmecia] bisecta]|uniref:Uncharacterized protein n=1 Tax=[Myrmecia] bisecta TaxID=41462 RepID=A0AAW1PNF1_9CHLO
MTSAVTRVPPYVAKELQVITEERPLEDRLNAAQLAGDGAPAKQNGTQFVEACTSPPAATAKPAFERRSSNMVLEVPSVSPDTTAEQFAERLATLLLSRGSHSALASALQPLLQALQQQADSPPGQRDPHKLPLWNLVGQPQLEAAMLSYFSQPAFGSESDPVCQWLYDWYRSDRAPLLHRFVARFAPHLATQFLLNPVASGSSGSSGGSSSGRGSLPGLEAVLVAVYEQQPAQQGIEHLPDLSQQSVYHVPHGAAARVAVTQKLAREPSMSSSARSAHSVMPPGVAALFGSSKVKTPKMLRGVHTWQRDVVAAAAFRAFTVWMTTFSDEAVAEFAQLAYSLGAAGCSWAHAEADCTMQEQLKLGQSLPVVPATAGAASCSHRVSLTTNLLEPVGTFAAGAVEAASRAASSAFMGLSRTARETAAIASVQEDDPDLVPISEVVHPETSDSTPGGAAGPSQAAPGAATGKVRLADSSSGSSRVDSEVDSAHVRVALANGSSKASGSGSRALGNGGAPHHSAPVAEAVATPPALLLRDCVIGAVLVLHVRATYELSPEGMILTQALVAQIKPAS